MKINHTLEKSTFLKKWNSDYLEIYPKIQQKIKFLENFYFDKVIYSDKTNIIRKMEIYNYIPRKNINNIIKYLNTKQFKFLENKKDFPKIFNILLSQNNKHINWKWVILNENFLPKYHYYVDYVKVLNHRWRPILIKIYRNKSQNREYSKIEITYSYFKKSYNLYFLDFLNALKWMNELLKKISKKIQYYELEEEMDFSKRINFDKFLEFILTLKNKNNKNYNQKIKNILIWT